MMADRFASECCIAFPSHPTQVGLRGTMSISEDLGPTGQPRDKLAEFSVCVVQIHFRIHAQAGSVCFVGTQRPGDTEELGARASLLKTLMH